MLVRTHGAFFRQLTTSAFLLSTVHAADAAVIDCSTSPVVVNASTGHYTASSTDVYQTTGSCFQVYDGKNVDLNGARIECTNPGSPCGGLFGGTCYCDSAIEAYAAGSLVEGGTISGPFHIGVEGAEEVRDMTIDGAFYGITAGSYGRRVHRNVIRNNVWGVYGLGLASTSFVRDNVIELNRPQLYGSLNQFSFYGDGIVVWGTSGSGISVETNYIRDFGGTGSNGQTGSAINAGTSPGNNVRVTGNVLERIDCPILVDDPSNPAVLDRNTCDDSSVCPLPSPPYALP
jgi:hypothetical protein